MGGLRRVPGAGLHPESADGSVYATVIIQERRTVMLQTTPKGMRQEMRQAGTGAFLKTTWPGLARPETDTQTQQVKAWERHAGKHGDQHDGMGQGC